jgi:predicted nucleotidyltransferase
MAKKTTAGQILNVLREEFPYLKEHFKVVSLSLFGSYVKNKQTSESDIDILVGFSETPGFLEFIKLENHLTDKLDRRVDLVMEDALKPNIGSRAREEAISV